MLPLQYHIVMMGDSFLSELIGKREGASGTQCVTRQFTRRASHIRKIDTSLCTDVDGLNNKINATSAKSLPVDSMLTTSVASRPSVRKNLPWQFECVQCRHQLNSQQSGTEVISGN
jgi:hypothetical protein